MKKKQQVIKPWTEDCFGKLFTKMNQVELISVYESLKKERAHNSFWNEGLRYQKKHTATVSYIESLIKL